MKIIKKKRKMYEDLTDEAKTKTKRNDIIMKK